MFLSELRKLIGNVKILLIIAAAMVVNSVFLIIPEFGDYSPAAYNSLWNRLNELPAPERADFISERIADYDDSRWYTGSGFCGTYPPR